MQKNKSNQKKWKKHFFKKSSNKTKKVLSNFIIEGVITSVMQ
jgi:hypothetical protein